jgi:hypothetical protein
MQNQGFHNCSQFKCQQKRFLVKVNLKSHFYHKQSNSNILLEKNGAFRSKNTSRQWREMLNTINNYFLLVKHFIKCIISQKSSKLLDFSLITFVPSHAKSYPPNKSHVSHQQKKKLFLSVMTNDYLESLDTTNLKIAT